MERGLKAVCLVIVVVAVSLLLHAGMVSAAVVDSADYRPVITVYPDTEVAVWTKYATGSYAASIVESRLLLDSTQTGSLLYGRAIDSVFATDTVTVEAKVKLEQYSGTYDGGCGIWFGDDVTSQVMTIFPDKIKMYFPFTGGQPAGAYYTMNTMDAYHTYKIVFMGAVGRMQVFVDGGEYPVIDTTLAANWGYDRNWIAFGDGSGNSGSKASWEYVTYQIER